MIANIIFGISFKLNIASSSTDFGSITLLRVAHGVALALHVGAASSCFNSWPVHACW